MIIDDLALSYFNIPKSTLISALKKFGSAEKIFNSSLYELTMEDAFEEKTAEKILRHKKENLAKATIEYQRLRDYNIGIVSFGSHRYPTLLAECCDAPVILYYIGNENFTVDDEKWISIIGTKSATEIGYLVTDNMIADIAKYHPHTVIVSSLSEGIERRVHTQSVKAGLRSVAVLHVPLENIGNEGYRDLIAQILKTNGTIISEYPIDAPYYSNRYNERNRIVAGLSHAMILVEAPVESNTMTTVSMSKSYQREIFTFPGRVTDNNYKGNNTLIKSQSAEMITSFEDVALSLMMPRKSSMSSHFVPQMSVDEKIIYECLIDGAEHSDEELLDRTGFDSKHLTFLLISMESDAIIVSLPGRLYMIKPR